MNDAMTTPADATGLDDLEVFREDHPRAVFFRKAPRASKFVECEYLAWAERYRDLDGLVGKVLEEELPRPRDVTQKYYRRFKRDHPHKLVLLHFNGKGRRPSFAGDRFSPVHWLYLAGSTVTEDAAGTDMWLTVEDATRFKMRRKKGRNNDGEIVYDDYPDDLVIVPPQDPDGRKDSNDRKGLGWSQAEHGKLLDVDEDANRIKVRRGVWRERGRVVHRSSVDAGSYVAPHARIRPPVLADENDTLWLYNFAAVDHDERTCADVLADELRGYFDDEAMLGLFDGIQFDVMFFVPRGRVANPNVVFCYDEGQVDVGNDGRPDGEIVGRNAYGLGVVELGEKLRAALPGKLLLADGMLPEVHQRNFGSFDGMESEGFPILRDPGFAEWSPALNRHLFWQSRVGADPDDDRRPFNYALFKYIGTHNDVNADDPDRRHEAYARFRLAAAAAVFTDAAVAIGSNFPQGSEIFDELWNGKAEDPNWLGQDRGPAVQLTPTTGSEDLCDGLGVTWPAHFVERISGPGATATREGDPPRVRISWRPDAPHPDGTAGDTGAPLHKVTVPVPSPFPQGPGGSGDEVRWDLFVELRLTGEGVPGYPSGIARRIRVQALVDGKAVPTSWEQPDGRPAASYFTWADGEPFTSTFLFRDAPAGRAEVEIVAEGGTDLVLHRLTVHAGRGEMMREFANGVVLANPSLHEVELDLASLFGDQQFRRIDGHDDQDCQTNDGQPIEGRRIKLPGRDARFLVKDPRAAFRAAEIRA